MTIMSEPPQQQLEVGVVERSAENDPDYPNDDAYEQALAASTPSDFCAAVEPEDPMILMYTSGTTGHPKGALLPHRKTLFNCRNAELYFGIEDTDRVLVVAPLFHSLGLQILALPALYMGAGIVLQEGFDPDAATRHARKAFAGFDSRIAPLRIYCRRGRLAVADSRVPRSWTLDEAGLRPDGDVDFDLPRCRTCTHEGGQRRASGSICRAASGRSGLDRGRPRIMARRRARSRR